MESHSFFKDARRKEADRVIVCSVSNLHQVGFMVGAVENVVYGRRPVVDKPEQFFFLFEHLDGQMCLVLGGQDKPKIFFFKDLCLRFSI